MSIAVRRPMASDLIQALQDACLVAGVSDLQIMGGNIHDDTKIRKVIILNRKSEDWEFAGGVPVGVFIE